MRKRLGPPWMTPDEWAEYLRLSHQARYVTSPTLSETELEKIRNRTLSELLDNPAYSFNARVMLSLNRSYHSSAVIWGYQNFNDDQLFSLIRHHSIRRYTIIPASQNRHMTWEMVEYLLLSKNPNLTGYNLNRFLRKLNDGVWTKEFIMNFFRYVDGRDQIPVGYVKNHGDIPVFLDVSILYNQARRVFGLEGYPDEWVQQVISDSTSV